jgi:transposase
MEEDAMPRNNKTGKSHPAYPKDFRRQLVEIVRAGRTPAELAREFEPTAEAIRKWVKQADLDEGRREDGLTTPERRQLVELERENRQLKEEREILKKAAAWFARETNSVPGGSSNS